MDNEESWLWKTVVFIALAPFVVIAVAIIIVLITKMFTSMGWWAVPALFWSGCFALTFAGGF